MTLDWQLAVAALVVTKAGITGQLAGLLDTFDVYLLTSRYSWAATAARAEEERR
jgi:hypothetical protein